MPRKKIGPLMVRQTFTNHPDMASQLRALSYQNNVSVSQIIRDALRVYFTQLKADDAAPLPPNDESR